MLFSCLGLLFKEIYEHVEVDEEVSMQQLTINAKNKRKVPFNLDITTKVSQTGEVKSLKSFYKTVLTRSIFQAICISDAKNDNRFRLIVRLIALWFDLFVELINYFRRIQSSVSPRNIYFACRSALPQTAL